MRRIKEIAETRVRYGYRRIHVLLCREGWRVNVKCVYRLYHAMGLQLRNKTPKRRVKTKLRDDRTAAVRNNEIWAMDFVHDQLATGKKLRVLTIIDTFSRFSPAVEARFSYRGSDVVETLERVARQYGLPKVMCGRRPRCKRNLTLACGRVQVMCPACLRGAMTAGPDVVRGSGPNHSPGLDTLDPKTGSPNQQIDRFASRHHHPRNSIVCLRRRLKLPLPSLFRRLRQAPALDSVRP